MRSFVVAAFGLALLLTAGIAAPAQADTTKTFDVPVDTIVPVPAGLLMAETAAWSPTDPQDTPAWAATGPLSLPLTIDFAAAGFYANALAIPAPPEGCTRIVNSYRYTYERISQIASWGGPVSVGMIGETTTFVAADDSVPDQRTWTISLPETRPSTDIAFIYQVFRALGPASTTLLGYSVNVTDACPTVVDETPVVLPAQAPAGLPETGAEALPLGLGALALLLSGMAILATRRISRSAAGH